MSESAARPAGPHRSCSLLKCHLFLSNDLHNAKLLTRKIQIKRGRESFWNQGAISRERGGRPGGPLLTPSLPAAVCPAWMGTLWPPAFAPNCQEGQGRLGATQPSLQPPLSQEPVPLGGRLHPSKRDGWRGAEGWDLLRSSLCGCGDPHLMSSDISKECLGPGEGPSPPCYQELWSAVSAELELGPAAAGKVGSLGTSSA